MNDVHDARLHKNAEDSLANLSSTFAAVGFHDPSEARRKARQFKRTNEVFFIPEKEEGMHLMECKSYYHQFEDDFNEGVSIR